MNTLPLFHTGFEIIESPDLKHGRKNADFGQGFYLSPNKEFCRRWARTQKGRRTFLNSYELDLHDLKVREFARDEEWFDYIFSNRSFQPDQIIADVIIGPIANDTIYDTWGIITSGLLKKEIAFPLLCLGKSYIQAVIKTEKAKAALHFKGAEELSEETVLAYQKTLKEEEQHFQEQFAALLEKLTAAKN